MINKYDYIKYPKDKLYLRVQNLIKELTLVTIANGNLEAYSYLRTILSRITADAHAGYIKESEEHILDTYFLNHRCFKDLDREKMIPIIREYKLNMLL